MVQKKAPPNNKLGIKIKPYHLIKPDNNNNTHLANLRPSSPQSHDHLKKIMKKSRPIKRPDESSANSRSSKKKRSQPLDDEGAAVASPQKRSPNYMKSTSSFEARKERSPPVNKTPSPKAEKGSRTSSLKMVRTLTKSPSFKPLRPSKKCVSSSVILCEEDLDAQRATCSSTLKDSKFPDILELSPGGTELDGTSAMKVCPYTYCSLNGHHHPPLPPLRCFLAARRRGMKTQKSFKLGCLSPRHTKPVVKKTEEIVSFPEEAGKEVGMKEKHVDRLTEEESKDFFIEIYGKGSRDSESSDMDWEEGNGFAASCLGDGSVCEEEIKKTGFEVQDSYDERSVTSGGWSDSESDGSYQKTENNRQTEDQDFPSSITKEADFDGKIDEDKIKKIIEEKKNELQGFPIGDHDIKCNIDYKQEKSSQESETSPNVAENPRDGSEKRHTTTIIYNIVQFNISIYINGEKTEHSETDKEVTLQVPVPTGKMETEEQSINNDTNNPMMIKNEELRFDVQEIVENEQLNAGSFTEKCEHEEIYESLGLEVTAQHEEDVVEEMEEEHERKSEEKETVSTEEITSMDATNLRGSTRAKKPDQEMEDGKEFNPRGPNFLPEVADPDAEKVDLRHQTLDERKQAEEWMVDFALQQAVTTLAPARKRKVALLVEAFEKVMPVPKYDTVNRRTPKAFANARPMQACS